MIGSPNRHLHPVKKLMEVLLLWSLSKSKKKTKTKHKNGRKGFQIWENELKSYRK